MHICFLDEAGCSGSLKSASDSVQPVLVLTGVFVAVSELTNLTEAFLQVKHRYAPSNRKASRYRLEDILTEIKGADLRTSVRVGKRAPKRRAIGLLNDTLEILEKTRAKYVATVYVKGIGQPCDEQAMYAAAVQRIAKDFQNYLTGSYSRGVIVADGRSKAKNVGLAHSIFTQRYKVDGDEFNRLIELPLFGNSENHAGLQVCDLLCSGLLFPMAAYSYCLGHVSSVHVSQRYSEIKRRFGARLSALQHRYPDRDERMRGGVTVSDRLEQRSSAMMFR